MKVQPWSEQDVQVELQSESPLSSISYCCDGDAGARILNLVKQAVAVRGVFC